MSLDPRFVLAPSLEMYFVDKDTGLPLSGGQVFFWKDQARNQPKPVYKISGTPPNYSYTELPNPCILSAVGTFQDDEGNDILPYYFPYEGTPDNSDGTVELYFVEVLSASDIPQFTREGWPNTIAASDIVNATSVTNFVPNGQFITHNNLPATDVYSAGEIRAPITEVAPGYWTFERPAGSTAFDVVTFLRFNAYTTNPTTSPRYAIRINNQTPGTDAFKDLRLKFRDVNIFSSDTQEYTFSITGRTNIGSSQPVGLILIKNYGTGGSTTVETTLTNYTFSAAFNIFNFSFTFGNNTGKTIGPNNDDFIQLALRFPGDAQFSVDITDVSLLLGNVTVNAFPIETETQMLAQSLAGTIPVPDYDGANLNLPIVSGKNGFEYDTSVIGMVYASSVYTVPFYGYLLADGSQYETSSYSSDGIPYRRLQSKYYVSTYDIPLYGTGTNYLTGYPINGNTSYITISTNTAGSVSATTDGAAPTGMTFGTLASGNTSYGVAGYIATANGNNDIFVFGDVAGFVTAASAGNSGFTVTQISNAPLVRQVFVITTIAASSITAGHYLTFNTPTTGYYVWFQINGSGSDPAIGGRTGIMVNLISTFTAYDVAGILANAISARNVTDVLVSSGNTIPASSYFNINTISALYYVWFKVDGIGTDPALVGKIGIETDILSTDTAAQVGLKIRRAVNSKYFATPDYRGEFLRGIDLSQFDDPDALNRFSITNDGRLSGGVIGSYEQDNFQNHLHSLTFSDGMESIYGFETTDQLVGGLATSSPGLKHFVLTGTDTGYAGGAETRPINQYVCYLIRY
jgi:hypothetical protein